ncbi:Peptidyl-tRNA hydrolase [Diplonema papillatum]|nr:Peptidyl-tRNA hydrolase [Diplonema papillatum]
MVHPQKLVVGLGNPNIFGMGTPHNFGRVATERFSGSKGWEWWWTAMSWVKEDPSKSAMFVLPGLPMNLSGWCVHRVVQTIQVDAGARATILIIADDLRLPLGQVVLSPSISGAHRGLQSVAYSLSDTSIPVLRLGANRRHLDMSKGLSHGGVLQTLTPDQCIIFEESLPQALARISGFLLSKG